MTLAFFTPPGDEIADRLPEDVDVLGPAKAATGLAFVVRGLETGRKFLAWADELCVVGEPAEVSR